MSSTLAGVEGFNDKTAGTALNRFFDVFLARVAGNHYDYDFRMLFLDVHNNVSRPSISGIMTSSKTMSGLYWRNEVEGEHAILGFANDFVIFAAQNAAQQGAHHVVVVDDQDFRCRGHGAQLSFLVDQVRLSGRHDFCHGVLPCRAPDRRRRPDPVDQLGMATPEATPKLAVMWPNDVPGAVTRV